MIVKRDPLNCHKHFEIGFVNLQNLNTYSFKVNTPF